MYHSRVLERAPALSPEHRLNSTGTLLEEFLSGAVWKDMVDVLDMWREIARARLETAEELREVYVLQGEALAYAKLLRLPEALLEHIGSEISSQKEQTNAGPRVTRTTV